MPDEYAVRKPGARGRVGQAGPLSRDRIVRAALRVVEREGVDLLTMRRVADEIGTAPMSLYRHVTDKRELLLELLDLTMREVLSTLPPGPADPRQRLIDAVEYVYRLAILANRWSAQALLTVEELPPSALGLSEYLLAVMYEAGLDEWTAAYAHNAIWHYIWGHLTFGHLSAASARAFEARHANPVELPALARTATALRDVASRDAFVVGLTALVDGFFPAT